MTLAYQVKLTPDSNGTLLVTCPALPEVTTFGEDKADALAHAADAIGEALAARIAEVRISLTARRARPPYNCRRRPRSRSNCIGPYAPPASREPSWRVASIGTGNRWTACFGSITIRGSTSWRPLSEYSSFRSTFA